MKQYIVVGGSSGIGAALTKKLADEGNQVLVISREARGIDQINHVTHISADVTSLDSSQINWPEEIHGLAYCPGSIQLKPFHRLKEKDFLSDWNVNVMGAVQCVQQALSGLKAVQGSVLLFSTVAVQTGMPFHSSIAMAKGALEGLTRSLAAEYAPTLRVNCIAPSLTNTPLAERLLSTPEKQEASAKRHPMNAVGDPEDIASIAALFLSDHAKWVTGQIIGVDGGIGSIKTV